MAEASKAEYPLELDIFSSVAAIEAPDISKLQEAGILILR
jgi:hypothetical protein